MSAPSVEERLRRLAGELEAPATTTALDAIERRTQVLRRRRHVGVATLVAVGAVVAVLAVVLLRAAPSSERTVELDPVQPDFGDGLPTIVVDLDGWELSAAGVEEDVALTPTPLPDADDPDTSQVFRRPGEMTAPSILLQHFPVRGTIGNMFDQPVTIRGVEGMAWVVDEDDVAVTWDPHGGNTTAWVQAKGLTLDQVVEFANGLEPRDADIASPPGPDDRFGFEATAPVAGLVEDPVAPGGGSTGERRTTAFTDGTDVVTITVDEAGERALESDIAGSLVGSWSTVTVLDRPAALHTGSIGLATPVDPTPDGMVAVHWMHGATARVTLSITTDDPDAIDAVLASLRQVPESEWDGMLTRVPPPSTTTQPTMPPSLAADE